MSDLKIQRLFETRLDAWAEGQGLRVQHANESYTPTIDPYLQAILVPARPFDEFMSGGHTALVGLFQMNIFGALNVGSAPNGLIAEALQALFPNCLKLTDDSGFSVSVVSPLAAPQGFNDGGRWLTPTSFFYRADTTT